MIWWLVLACSDYSIREPDPPPVADPPVSADDRDWGEPPSWSSCDELWLGRYYNLTADELPVDTALAGDSADTGFDLDALDPWATSRQVFSRWDPTLDQGPGWYPVDQDLPGDPDGFAARWTAWIRVYERGTLTWVFGAASDAWLEVNGETWGELHAQRTAEPDTLEVYADPGQYKVELRMLHRLGTPGLTVRLASGDAQICPGDFSTEAEDTE